MLAASRRPVRRRLPVHFHYRPRPASPRHAHFAWDRASAAQRRGREQAAGAAPPRWRYDSLAGRQPQRTARSCAQRDAYPVICGRLGGPRVATRRGGRVLRRAALAQDGEVLAVDAICPVYHPHFTRCRRWLALASAGRAGRSTPAIQSARVASGTRIVTMTTLPSGLGISPTPPSRLQILCR